MLTDCLEYAEIPGAMEAEPTRRGQEGRRDIAQTVLNALVAMEQAGDSSSEALRRNT